ncbi:MAG: nucleotidyltransferase domain-containing protein [Candidatus Pacearchaeota archaeon]
MEKKDSKISKIVSKSKKDFPTLKLINEKEIAMDFAVKAYEKFNKMIKSIILFGSQIKGTAKSSSDIDIMILIDDASIQWDEELIAWYREELSKLIAANPYQKELHINSTKLTTWWNDLLKGDPVVLNIVRYGIPLIDFGGFFEPLKILMQQGKIRPTPEAIYACLQRTPYHIGRSKAAELNAIEGLYWALVDSAHAALMAAKQMPPSPENIPVLLKEIFVDTGNLKKEHIDTFNQVMVLHKKIINKEISDLKGVEIDMWQEKTEKFVQEMTRLVNEVLNL